MHIIIIENSIVYIFAYSIHGKGVPINYKQMTIVTYYVVAGDYTITSYQSTPASTHVNSSTCMSSHPLLTLVGDMRGDKCLTVCHSGGL